MLGISQLDILIFTHAHSDHIGGGVTIINQLNPKKIYYKEIDLYAYENKHPDEVIYKQAKMFEEILLTARNKGCELIKVATNGFEIKINEYENLKFYNMQTDINKTLNELSMMNLYSFKGSKTLFAGDCPFYEAKQFLSSMGLTNNCLKHLKMAHHGGSGSVDLEYLTITRPRTAFFTGYSIPVEKNLLMCKYVCNCKTYTALWGETFYCSFLVTQTGVIPNTNTREEYCSNELFTLDNSEYHFINSNGECVNFGIVNFLGNDYLINNYNKYIPKVDFGWGTYKGNEYCFRSDGRVVKNQWVKSNSTDSWYYVGNNGIALMDCKQVIGNVEYTFESSGRAVPSPI